MSAVVSEMLIRIAADTAQLRSQMQQAERTVGGSLDGIKNVATQARNALIGFFAFDKAMDLAGAFIKTADAMTLTAARLKLVTASQQEYQSVQKDVYRIAQQNNIGLEEMSQLYTKLHDPVKRLGGTTAETTKITESFALALRVGGANTQEAASATLQFAQAMASGKLSGDEFRSIAEASPRFMKALAEGMNVPIEQLKKMGSESKLTADVVGNALMKSLATLQQEAQSIPDTVGGAFTRLKNDVGVFATELNGATGATSGLAEVIGGLADWVKQITEAFRVWGEATKNSTYQVDLAGIAIRVLGTIFETLIVIGSEVAYMVRGIGKAFDDVATLAKAFADGGLDGLSAAYQRVTAENEATREAHNKFTASVVGATDRVLEQRDALKNNGLSAAENASEIARLTGRHGEMETAVLKSKVANEEATKAEQKRLAEVQKLMQGLQDQTGALMMTEQATEKMTKAEQTALKVMQDLQQGRIKLTDAEKVALAASLENLIATEKRINADKDLIETQRKVAEHSAKLTDAQWKEVESLREGNIKLMENNERLRDGDEAVRQREVAVLRSRATDLEWQAAMEGGNAALEEQARLLRDRANLVEDNAGLEAAKKVREEWEQTSKNIESSLTDSLMRAFESGKGFGRALKDTLLNMFNTLILRPIIQPIAQGMAGGVLGMLGMPAQAAGGGSGLGGLLGSAGSAIGSMFGAGGLTGALMGGAGWLTGATTLTGALGAAGSLIGTGTAAGAMSGLAMGAGALGPIALGGALLLNAMGAFKGPTPHSGGTGSYSATQGMGYGSSAYSFGMAESEYRKEVNESSAELARAISGILDTASSALGSTRQFWVGTGFADDSSKDGAWGGLMIKDALNQVLVDWGRGGDNWPGREFADGEKGQKEYLSAIAVDVRKVLEGIGLPGWATEMLNELGDAPTLEQLGKAVEYITQATQAMASINSYGGIFSMIANSSTEAREALIGMAGGIDQLMGKVQGFVQQYYSQDEQSAIAARNVVSALRSVGLDTGELATREDFRALVESRDIESEMGRQQLVALLDLAPQFANLADYLAQSDTTLEELAQAAPQVAVLNQILDPSKITADNTAQMATSLEQSNSTLTAIESKLDNIASVTETAVEAAKAAAAAAAAAASAASDAASTASTVMSRPNYTYDVGIA